MQWFFGFFWYLGPCWNGQHTHLAYGPYSWPTDSFRTQVSRGVVAGICGFPHLVQVKCTLLASGGKGYQDGGGGMPRG